MRFLPALFTLSVGFATLLASAEPEFPLTADSKPQDGVPKGTLIKDSHTAGEGSVFPGTEREVTLYLPAGFDRTKPASFMVFQDGVIYQAPVVFDNLIARGDIPPLVGVFVQPGVVPAPNENAQPRYNRSYEYDSVTDTYSTFLIDELLPALEEKHGLTFSTDPNDTAIAGNSSGGICAFMTAWHRQDRFRRVFSGVGTYVGIRGADRLPVLIRKFEPKPLRVFLQSGTGDNNLYCGDWWMANQMMERSLTWAGYDVNHARGEGGHNQKHASQIFPDVLRWLWRDWKTDREIKANPKGESQWKGYEVVGDGEWEVASAWSDYVQFRVLAETFSICSNASGEVYISAPETDILYRLKADGERVVDNDQLKQPGAVACGPNGRPFVASLAAPIIRSVITRPTGDGAKVLELEWGIVSSIALTADGRGYAGSYDRIWRFDPTGQSKEVEIAFDATKFRGRGYLHYGGPDKIVLSPDQKTLFACTPKSPAIVCHRLREDGSIAFSQKYAELEKPFEQKDDSPNASGMCVDVEGRLYVTTKAGVQVCDQLGRVNFIIKTPSEPHDIAFGGKCLTQLFIVCKDALYKRPTKDHGIVSGQMPPVKAPKPKL